MLKLKNVHTRYGTMEILKNINISVQKGQLVCLLGGNASGKSTTMKAILGIVKPFKGKVIFDGNDMRGVPTAQRIKFGLATVPENRRLFPKLTVKENLLMGAFTRDDKKEINETFDYVCELFPRVKERLFQKAGTLSGGEQQMVAMGRALMSKPKMIIMDEPSMGLSPALVDQNFEIIKKVNNEGITIFVVEQNANAALSIADYGYVLRTGRIIMEGKASELLKSKEIRHAYLGES